MATEKIPEVHLFVEKLEDGRYEARMTGLCVVLHEGEVVARSEALGMCFNVANRDDAVLATIHNFVELTFGPFTRGPVELG